MILWILFIYLTLVIVFISCNFEFVADFVNHDISEEIQDLREKNNVPGRITKILTIFLFIFLLPILITIIQIKGVFIA